MNANAQIQFDVHDFSILLLEKLSKNPNFLWILIESLKNELVPEPLFAQILCHPTTAWHQCELLLFKFPFCYYDFLAQPFWFDKDLKGSWGSWWSIHRGCLLFTFYCSNVKPYRSDYEKIMIEKKKSLKREFIRKTSPIYTQWV